MNNIYFLSGLPASGKTTWSKQKIEEAFKAGKTTKRVNKDDLRAMLDNGQYSSANEQFILRIRNYIIAESLNNKFDVIVDDCNFNSYHEKIIKEMAKEYGAKIIKLPFETEVEECITRDEKRDKPVGKKIILDFYNKYIKKNG